MLYTNDVHLFSLLSAPAQPSNLPPWWPLSAIRNAARLCRTSCIHSFANRYIILPSLPSFILAVPPLNKEQDTTVHTPVSGHLLVAGCCPSPSAFKGKCGGKKTKALFKNGTLAV